MRAAAQRAAALLLAQPGALRGEAGAAAARGFSAWSGPTEVRDISEEWYLRQRRSMPLGNRIPHSAADAWIAPNAVVVGDVDLLDRVGGRCTRGDAAAALRHSPPAGPGLSRPRGRRRSASGTAPC
jgi:hypothetical protein